MAMVHIDTIAVYIGGSLAQADWLGPKVDGHVAPFCIHRMKRVNSRNGCAMNVIMSFTIIITIG